MHRIVAIVPVAALRSEPAHRSEMSSQLLFGESAEMLEERSDGWIKIRCDYDGYEGWAQQTQFSQAEPRQEQSIALAPDWINEIGFNGNAMKIPMGSILNGIEGAAHNWYGNQLRYSGKKWWPEATEWKMQHLLPVARAFLNTPYLWGGKSVFGIDCSGFTQTVFRFFNKPLRRDAWQQAGQGEELDSPGNYKPGDLAFFDNEAGRITHVGLLLGDSRIIHASGKVRIDRIDNSGIINLENGRKTHNLKLIKRFGIDS